MIQLFLMLFSFQLNATEITGVQILNYERPQVVSLITFTKDNQHYTLLDDDGVATLSILTILHQKNPSIPFKHEILSNLISQTIARLAHYPGPGSGALLTYLKSTSQWDDLDNKILASVNSFSYPTTSQARYIGSVKLSEWGLAPGSGSETTTVLSPEILLKIYQDLAHPADIFAPQVIDVHIDPTAINPNHELLALDLAIQKFDPEHTRGLRIMDHETFFVKAALESIGKFFKVFQHLPKYKSTRSSSFENYTSIENRLFYYENGKSEEEKALNPFIVKTKELLSGCLVDSNEATSELSTINKLKIINPDKFQQEIFPSGQYLFSHPQATNKETMTFLNDLGFKDLNVGNRLLYTPSCFLKMSLKDTNYRDYFYLLKALIENEHTRELAYLLMVPQGGMFSMAGGIKLEISLLGQEMNDMHSMEFKYTLNDTSWHFRVSSETLGPLHFKNKVELIQIIGDGGDSDLLNFLISTFNDMGDEVTN